MNGQDRRSGRRRAYDIFFKTVVYLSAFLTVALLVVLIGYIFVRGLPHITGQLLSTAPSVLKDTIGILPNILNTLYIILFTLLIALPLGVGAAVYLTEYASNKTFIRIVEFATETLGASRPLSTAWWACCSSRRCWAFRRAFSRAGARWSS